MSVVPSDSVSRAGASGISVDNPISSICPPTHPSDAFIAAVGGKAEKYMDKYFAAYQSYCRTLQNVAGLTASGSSCSSGSSASVESSAGSAGVAASSRSSSFPASGVSTTADRLDCGSRVTKSAVGRLARSMRASGVVSTLPGGYCYVRAMRPEARESAAMALGAYPALGDLLSRPREEFMPLSATSGLSVVIHANGVAHVKYSDAGGEGRYNRFVAGLSRRAECAFGTYGALLRSTAPHSDLPEEFQSVDLSTPIGGDGSFRVDGVLRFFSVGQSSSVSVRSVTPTPPGTTHVMVLHDGVESYDCALPFGTVVLRSYEFMSGKFNRVFVFYLAGSSLFGMATVPGVALMDVAAFEAMSVCPVVVSALLAVGETGRHLVEVELLSGPSDLRPLLDSLYSAMRCPVASASVVQAASGGGPLYTLVFDCLSGSHAKVVARQLESTADAVRSLYGSVYAAERRGVAAFGG